MRLVDSDVLIWNWRGQQAAAALLATEAFALSAVSYMELVQGMRNARELYFSSAPTSETVGVRYNCWFARLNDIWDKVQRTTGAWTPRKLQQLCNIA